MTNYASKTEVTPDRSRAEIERILLRYGATSFAYAWQDDMAIVMFELQDRRIRYMVPMPKRDEFAVTESGRSRTSGSINDAWQQAMRARWRALVLSIKARLEDVYSGIDSVEEAFMSKIVMPDGLTVGEHVLPKIAQAYLSNKMPPMLMLGAGNARATT